MPSIETINIVLAWLTVAGQVSTVILLILFLANKFLKLNFKILDWVSDYAVPFSGIVALIAMGSSLYYSEVAQYAPCLLCWYQRTLMYPQVFLAITAFFLKDKKAAYYIFTLSFLGLMIAIYHTYIQYGGSELFSCGAQASSVSCTERFVFQLNYITIPLMSLTGFALNTTFSLINIFNTKNYV